MNKPLELLEELTVIQVGLRMNVLSQDLLVKFSDKVISEEKNPDNLFIDISLSSTNKNELIDKLSPLGVVYKLHPERAGGLSNSIRTNLSFNTQWKTGIARVSRCLLKCGLK